MKLDQWFNYSIILSHYFFTINPLSIIYHNNYIIRISSYRDFFALQCVNVLICRCQNERVRGDAHRAVESGGVESVMCNSAYGNFVSLVCPRAESVIYIIIDVTLLVPIREVDNTVAICRLFYRETLLHTRPNFGACISKGETGALLDYNRCCLSLDARRTVKQ